MFSKKPLHKRVDLNEIDPCFFIGICFAILFIISLVPIVHAAFFTHPLLDDYGYSAPVYQTVKSGGNIFKILSAATGQVKSFYQHWQGTYSAIFLFSLQPGAFNLNGYYLTTFIILASLIIGVYVFTYTVTQHWLKFNKPIFLVISPVILTMLLQFLPSKAEAFYWYNGSIYYSFFFGLSLLFFSYLIKIVTFQKSKAALWVHTALCSLLGLFIAGGNYTTALTCIIILFTTVFVLVKNKNKVFLNLLLISIVFCCGFIISMLSPGNKVRGAAVTGMGAIPAIINSLKQGLRYLYEWTKLPQIVAFLFLAPAIYLLAKKCIWQFKYPFIVVLFSFGVFCAQFTPALYAMSSLGGGRQINIYYYSYYFLMLFCMFYLFGFFINNFNLSFGFVGQKMLNPKAITVFLLAFFVMFSAACYGSGYKKMSTFEVALAIKKQYRPAI